MIDKILTLLLKYSCAKISHCGLKQKQPNMNMRGFICADRLYWYIVISDDISSLSYTPAYSIK